MSGGYDAYLEANTYVDEGLIRTEVPEAPNPRCRREWMEWILPALDHPERAFAAVHVAGTSGKGSVATMIAEVLRAAGVRAGLHVSPYLQVATEKLWVDGAYASAGQYAALVRWLRPIAEARRGPHVPLHGMGSVAIALEHFRRSGVTLGVVEAGVGGRQDLTNVLQTELAVITRLGLDHIKTLGPDLASIAWHKAGIIKPGCRAVVLDGPAVAPCAAEARAVGAPLRLVDPAAGDVRLGGDGQVRLSYRSELFTLDGVELGMRGAFQAENAVLAVAAAEELVRAGHAISSDHVAAGLRRARLPGRLELIPAGPDTPCPVLLDGAHNPDKLTAMVGALPELAGGQLHVVYGGLGSRAPDDELRRLAARAGSMVITEPRVYGKSARPGSEIAEVVGPACPGPLAVEPSPAEAVQRALDRARCGDRLVVTGSLYLCGEIRDRWYPRQQVVGRRQSWF